MSGRDPAWREGRRNRLRLDAIDLAARIDDERDYERRLERLQIRMLKVQQAYHRDRRRAVIAVEGWDAAGKGGAIKRLTERLDPRAVKVWPIGPPAPEDQGRHYLYRFWQRLPEPGAIAIFDRSWYGRVLVERVEKITPPATTGRAYREINDFERLLIDDGVRLVKLFLHVSAAEQRARLKERLKTPYKRWKTGVGDFRNYELRRAYTAAVERMFDRTSLAHAPWFLIPAEHKWYARIAMLEIVTRELGRGVDLSSPAVAPEVLAAARRALGPKQLKKLVARSGR